jgi:hypothetical protein
MTSDWTEVAAIILALVRSVWRASSCQSKMLDLSLSCPGVVSGERSCVFRMAKAGERVMANPNLGVGLACLF